MLAGGGDGARAKRVSELGRVHSGLQGPPSLSPRTFSLSRSSRTPQLWPAWATASATVRPTLGALALTPEGLSYSWVRPDAPAPEAPVPQRFLQPLQTVNGKRTVFAGLQETLHVGQEDVAGWEEARAQP